MLDVKRREFIALLGGGGLLLAAKVRRARAQQPKRMRAIGVANLTRPRGTGDTLCTRHRADAAS